MNYRNITSKSFLIQNAHTHQINIDKITPVNMVEEKLETKNMNGNRENKIIISVEKDNKTSDK